MVNKINVRLYLSDHVNKSGKSKLYLQISIKRKIKRYALDLYVQPANFDKSKMAVVAGTDKDVINRIITRQLAKIDEIYLHLREGSREINFTNFENCYFNRDHTKLSHVIELHCQNIAYISQKPFWTIQKQLTKLWGDIPINEIDLLKINEFNKFLRHYKNNTAWSKHKILKSLLNTAIRYGIYKNENPYNKFKFRFIQTIRTYLSMDEINKIEQSFSSMPQLVQNVSTVFLFQCFTGLRYSDIYSLTWNNIQTNSIVLQMEKTDDIINIPLTKKAKAIINCISGGTDKNAKVFKVPSNQKYNDYLKLMADYSRINKTITSHVARHTFATISIELGIPIEIISKILGHKDLKTTKVYSQIINPVLEGYMKRWDA